MNNRFLIYGLADPITKEIRYIGKSSSGMNRPKQHFSKSSVEKRSYKSSWMQSLLKEGKQPEIIILDDTPTDYEELSSLEVEWIKRKKEEGCPLTNLTDGGEGTRGYKHSELTRKLLSSLKIGKPGIKGIPSPVKGVRRGAFSDEHKMRLSLGQKRRYQDNPEQLDVALNNLKKARIKQKVKIKCSNGSIYESITAAARSLLLHKPNLIAVLKGRYKTSGGLAFEYL